MMNLTAFASQTMAMRNLFVPTASNTGTDEASEPAKKLQEFKQKTERVEDDRNPLLNLV
ncbi:MAG TPA: hypothetical protein VIG66_07505 [Noviherbaspirillum sp.]